jgi:hypothetical protein
MQYMRLGPSQREELMAALTGMPAYLRSVFADVAPEQMTAPGGDGTPSPVEQVWHLADLEREGFGVRIERLLSEREPHLPDFDGTRIAAERDYRSRSFAEGLARFSEARQRNVEILRTLEPASWYASGTQEGVGPVSLCDIPGFMSQHDSAHRAEIESWRRSADR